MKCMFSSDIFLCLIWLI